MRDERAHDRDFGHGTFRDKARNLAFNRKRGAARQNANLLQNPRTRRVRVRERAVRFRDGFGKARSEPGLRPGFRPGQGILAAQDDKAPARIQAGHAFQKRVIPDVERVRVQAETGRNFRDRPCSGRERGIADFKKEGLYRHDQGPIRGSAAQGESAQNPVQNMAVVHGHARGGSARPGPARDRGQARERTPRVRAEVRDSVPAVASRVPCQLHIARDRNERVQKERSRAKHGIDAGPVIDASFAVNVRRVIRATDAEAPTGATGATGTTGARRALRLVNAPRRCGKGRHALRAPQKQIQT